MPQRPNLIVIVADQLRVDCLPGFNPESPVQTPHLDRLAAEGVRFAEAFTQHSVCSPSRVSFLSGRYPHVSGHRSLQYLLAPHPPFAVAQPWYSMYPRAQMPAPRQGSGRPPDFRAELAQLHGWQQLQTEDWQEIRAVYYGMISRLDQHLGRLQAQLEQHHAHRPLYRCFFSDHGEYLGDYGLVEKWPAGVEECLVRTPLLIAGPGLAQGERSEALVELLDVFPTLLELAGIEAGHAHFGRSFAACLREPHTDHREEVFSEGGFCREESDLLERGAYPYDLKSRLQHQRPESVGKVVALRDRTWTYVWRLYEPAELYHRASDPHELHNLAGQTAYQPVEQALKERLLRWQVATADLIDTRESERFTAVDLPRPGSLGRGSTGSG